MKNHPQDELLEKLFRNKCTPQELELLLKAAQDNAVPPAEDVFEKLWAEMSRHPKLETSMSEEIYSKVTSQINVKSERGRLRILKGKKLSYLMKAAAVILMLVFSLGWLIVSNVRENVIKTAYGEQRSLELSDGSKVQLNANSKMRFTPNWMDDENREIWLKGEAFFEVEKKPSTQQKFQVITDDVIVEVYGTTFNVNNHGDRTSVYLEEGEVRLYIEVLDSTVLMDEGDLITYWKKDQKIIRKRKELAVLHTSWKDGVLTFNEASLSDVVRRVEDIYGVKFKIVNEEFNSRELNIPLPINDLATAISILTKTMTDIEVYKKGDIYMIE